MDLGRSSCRHIRIPVKEVYRVIDAPEFGFRPGFISDFRMHCRTDLCS
jgi:hypothetical protein